MAAVAAAAAAGGGAAGVVAADALGMAARIVYSTWFVGRHFARVPGFRLRSLVPSTGTFAVLGAAAAATLLSAAVCGSGGPPPRFFLGFVGFDSAAALVQRLRLAADTALPGGEWARAGLHAGFGATALAAAAPAVLRAERGLIAELRTLHSEVG